MTGFACIEKQTKDYSIAVEIKSYNNRFLETSINLPAALSRIEPRIRAVITERCKRGKIEINIREKNLSTPLSVNINAEAVSAYCSAIERIKPLLSPIISAGQIPLEFFLGLEGVVENEKKNEDENKAWENISDAFFEAMRQFETGREIEGRRTEENILSYVTILEKSRDTISLFQPGIEQAIKDNIKLRFSELVDNEIDENRLLAETAIMLMKYTIAEEISRLSSHLTEFRAEIERNTSPGKKLDFICQEINREVNTIGSKTPVIEVSRAVINMKEAVENIREQLRNVE